MTMLSVIMAYRRNNPGTWSAVEIETFTLACMASAVDDAINAVHNNSNLTIAELRGIVDPERLLMEYREDFESKAIDFAIGERKLDSSIAPSVEQSRELMADWGSRQSIGRGLGEPPGPARIIGYAKTEPLTEADAPLYGHREVIPGDKFVNDGYAAAQAMASRRRELDQPAAMPLGHPVVVATTDKDQDGNAVERLVHMTTEEIEAANFKAFDPDKFVKPDDHFDAVQDAIYGDDEPDERPSATDIINDADPR